MAPAPNSTCVREEQNALSLTSARQPAPPGRSASGVPPAPQFARADWLNLNGRWEFEIDRSDTGLERGLRERQLEDVITVPFCPESALSGVGDTDFMEVVWYRRTVTVPGAWAGSRVLLHFGAVDHDTTVWVNGREVVRHRGGFTPSRPICTGWPSRAARR